LGRGIGGNATSAVGRGVVVGLTVAFMTILGILVAGGLGCAIAQAINANARTNRSRTVLAWVFGGLGWFVMLMVAGTIFRSAR
jgi:hypothetical protein